MRALTTTTRQRAAAVAEFHQVERVLCLVPPSAVLYRPVIPMISTKSSPRRRRSKLEVSYLPRRWQYLRWLRIAFVCERRILETSPSWTMPTLQYLTLSWRWHRGDTALHHECVYGAKGEKDEGRSFGEVEAISSPHDRRSHPESKHFHDQPFHLGLHSLDVLTIVFVCRTR